MMNDSRVEKLEERVREDLSLVTCVLGEIDAKLEEMTNSEWGKPDGQQLVAISNCLVGAKINLQDSLKFLEAVKAFDNKR